MCKKSGCKKRKENSKEQALMKPFYSHVTSAIPQGRRRPPVYPAFGYLKDFDIRIKLTIALHEQSAHGIIHAEVRNLAKD
jgi:hypothetical protein